MNLIVRSVFLDAYLNRSHIKVCQLRELGQLCNQILGRYWAHFRSLILNVSCLRLGIIVMIFLFLWYNISVDDYWAYLERS